MPKLIGANDKKETSKPPADTEGEKQLSSGIKVVVITTLITAIAGLLGTVATVYIQDVYRPSLRATQTVGAAYEAITQFSQTQTEQALAPQDTCPPPLNRAPTAIAILTEYVNVDRVDVYSEKDESIKPFQTLHRGDAVEILDHIDPVWACVTYSRDGSVRIYGYVLRDQLILGFELTETATVTP